MITEEHSLCMGCMSILDENGKCRCGYDEDALTDSACIQVRTVVGERYIVGRMIKMDGEGITYIGFDKENEERVYIREYMPQKIAKRNDLTCEVSPYPGCEAQYKTLMADFYDLFDSLRNFRHSEYLMPVINVIHDNNTVYAIYKFIKTISYGDYLTHHGGEFSWTQVKKLFMPLFTAITYLHSNGFVHRGISPESIRVNAKGQLMLWGFGTDSLYSKDTIIEPSLSAYSAPEQYNCGSWQGAWTDVYSIAAVLYKSLTGTLPSDAESRKEIDHLCPPEELNINIPSEVSDAIMNAMTLNREYRTPSIDDFTAELLESAKSNTKLFGASVEAAIKKADEEYSLPEEKEEYHKEPNHKKKVRLPWGLVATIIAMAVLLGVVAFLFRYTEILGLGNRKDPDEDLSSEISQSEDVDNEYLISMPNFIGRMKVDVEGNEQYASFDIIFEEENNNEYVEGMIFDQSVKYRTEVSEGSSVILKVSKGPEKVPMPYCVGMTLEDATRLLTELQISFQPVPNFSSEYEYNVVYEQSLDAETEVVMNDRITKVYIYYGALESNHSTSYWEDDDEGNPGITIIDRS